MWIHLTGWRKNILFYSKATVQESNCRETMRFAEAGEHENIQAVIEHNFSIADTCFQVRPSVWGPPPQKKKHTYWRTPVWIVRNHHCTINSCDWTFSGRMNQQVNVSCSTSHQCIISDLGSQTTGQWVTHCLSVTTVHRTHLSACQLQPESVSVFTFSSVQSCCHLLVINMEAGGALDSQPCFPLHVPDFVYLSKSTWAYFLPAAKLRGVKGPQQAHVPLWRIQDVHLGVAEPSSRVNSSFLPPKGPVGRSDHTHKLCGLWALPCFSPGLVLCGPSLYSGEKEAGLVLWCHFLVLKHSSMTGHRETCCQFTQPHGCLSRCPEVSSALTFLPRTREHNLCKESINPGMCHLMNTTSFHCSPTAPNSPSRFWTMGGLYDSG